ncbi:MAG: hypothetical protein KTR30_02875 [Saprospiraceae bacterium]|nr:hypothetical protein [Saprospiraceae bacterium]
MKRFWTLLLGSSLLFLTSCFDIIEEIHLKKNGSGKYIVTTDMSGLMSDGFMKQALEEAMKSEGGDMKMNLMDMDSSFTFASAPEAAELPAADRKLLEKVVISMKGSEKEEILQMGMTVNFDSFEDMERIAAVMKKVSKDGEGLGGGLMGGGQFSDFSNMFSMKKKKLFSRTGTSQPLDGLIQDDMKEMMSMMLAGASYKTIYNMPGKVKKSSIPASEIDGKTVTVEHPMLDVINQKVKIDGDIKFK